MNKWDALSAMIDQPSPDSTLQKTYDKRGHDLLQDYIDHAHSVHKALIENWGITVSPDPGSDQLVDVARALAEL